MTKIKIFESESSSKLEDMVNQWLALNTHITIVDIKQTDRMERTYYKNREKDWFKLVITITYEETDTSE